MKNGWRVNDMKCYYEDNDACTVQNHIITDGNNPVDTGILISQRCVACQIAKLREIIDQQGPRYSKKQMDKMGL